MGDSIKENASKAGVITALYFVLSSMFMFKFTEAIFDAFSQHDAIIGKDNRPTWAGIVLHTVLFFTACLLVLQFMKN